MRRGGIITVLAVMCGGAACGGATTPGGTDAGDAASSRPTDAALADACVPFCAANACDVGDTCGGICRCAAGVACVAGTCGGCLLVANDYCITSGPVDGSTPGTCCGLGDLCKFYGYAYVCCGITGQGGCVRDTDCCDYADGARCIPDADAGILPGICR